MNNHSERGKHLFRLPCRKAKSLRGGGFNINGQRRWQATRYLVACFTLSALIFSCDADEDVPPAWGLFDTSHQGDQTDASGTAWVAQAGNITFNTILKDPQSEAELTGAQFIWEWRKRGKQEASSRGQTWTVIPNALTKQATLTIPADQRVGAYELRITAQRNGRVTRSRKLYRFTVRKSGCPAPSTTNRPSTVAALRTLLKGLKSNSSAIQAIDTSQMTHFYESLGGIENGIIADFPTDPRAFRKMVDFDQPIGCWDVSNVTDMGYLFANAQMFSQDISAWDTSKVTDMTYMFRNARAFNTDISGWDTSNVIYMGAMFYNAQTFNQDINQWDTSKVERMHEMFAGVAAGNITFNRSLNNWDTSNVTHMEGMFANNTAFNGDISDWKTSKVTDMSAMFHTAQAFNADISGWDTSNVTDMRNMFFDATAFNQNLSSWKVDSVDNSTDFAEGATSWKKAHQPKFQ